MEQMYMIEIFIDKVSVFTDPQEDSTAQKKLIVTVRFGPRTEFVIKEGSFSEGKSDNKNIEQDEKTGRKTITREIRVGKAYLFPSYPDTVLQILDRFPLEISVWNDDENEKRDFVGIGNMHWDTEFYNMLRETSDACKPSKPLSIKQITPLMDECCCGQVGNISFILRLSALGGNIMTTFQQLPKDPASFIFTTDRNDSVFQCKRVEGDDPNFTMIGNLYESVTIEDPSTVVSSGQRQVQICTQMDSCATDADENTMYICGEKPKVKPVLSKIKMGDIKGPCGNTNCALAQKIKIYLRKTDAYKKEVAESGGSPNKNPKNRKVCGECTCNKDKWHREDCAEKKNFSPNADGICHGCGGVAKSGVTCQNKDDCDDLAPPGPAYDGCRDIPDDSSCNCKASEGKPLCGAYDCVCREEMVNKETRKEHRSYCPSYRHRPSCPVTTMNVEVEANTDDKDEDEKEEPLPYGLPPIILGPCPVTGRPCTVPDGFARMYKVQTQPPLPPSYGEAGKICCSKEFDRIKTFLKDCMKEDVQDNFRCFNALDATASMSRCCDKDQKMDHLGGKDCCGPHKAKGIPKRN